MTQHSNGLSNTVANFSDQKILAIIRTPSDYSKLIVNACAKEAQSRNIQSPGNNPESTSSLNSINFLHISEIRNFLNQGKTTQECEEFLLKKGLDINYVKATLQRASTTPPKYVPGKYEHKDHYGAKFGLVMFLAWLTFKLLTSSTGLELLFSL